MLSWDIKNGRWIIGDTFEGMATLADNSVDMVLCDLPYGTTACVWDTVIPFEPLWREYWRICKSNAAVILFASQPFTTTLIASQIEYFKYCWAWEKTRPGDIFNAKNKPLKSHEDIAVFSQGTTANGSNRRMPYYPQGVEPGGIRTNNPTEIAAFKAPRPSLKKNHVTQGSNYPRSILRFPNPNRGSLHPTQKPVALFEYLIRTYTHPDALVLDNTAGSGTTAIAAENTGRRWICIERDLDYSLAAMDRIANHA